MVIHMICNNYNSLILVTCINIKTINISTLTNLLLTLTAFCVGKAYVISNNWQEKNKLLDFIVKEYQKLSMFY